MALQPTNLLIQGSHLPATFRGTPNDLFVAILQRMKIVSPSGTAFFIISDNEPSSNQGPWLRGGTSWWVWSEELKRYVPISITDSEKTWFHFGASVPGSVDPPIWLRTVADPTEANPFPAPIAWNVWDGSAWQDFTTLKDRSVTQAKLAFHANFYVEATGVNDYQATFSPTADFSYGDGVNNSFACLIKFPNTNTNPESVTLNVNGAGARAVKKNVSDPVLAGEIVAGAVHLLVFDGTNFQIRTPVAVLPSTTRGIPNFFSPITVYSGPVVGFSVYSNAVADGVPANASAVILQCHAECGFSATDSTIQIRKLAGQPIYTALSIRQSGNGESLQVESQGIFPISVQTFGGVGFNYAVTGTLDGLASIKLIGYIS